MKGQVDKNTIMGKDINTLLSTMDKKPTKKTLFIDSTLDYVNLKDMYIEQSMIKQKKIYTSKAHTEHFNMLNLQNQP